MICFSCAAKEYGYHPDERKMLVVDGFRFVILFDVDKNCRSVDSDTLYMEFDTLTEALEIFDDRTILKPI